MQASGVAAGGGGGGGADHHRPGRGGNQSPPPAVSHGKKKKKQKKKSPPPPPPGKPVQRGPSMADVLMDTKAQQRAKAVETMRSKGAGRRRVQTAASIPPAPPGKPVVGAAVAGGGGGGNGGGGGGGDGGGGGGGGGGAVTGPRSSSLSPASSPHRDTGRRLSASTGSQLSQRAARGSGGGRGRSRSRSPSPSPSLSLLPADNNPLALEQAARHYHHPMVDLGAMSREHVPPQLFFEPFSTTPVRVLRLQEWAPFLTDTTLRQLSALNRAVRDLTLPSTMRTSTRVLQAALAAQPSLVRLRIVDTLATETAVADIDDVAAGAGAAAPGSVGGDGGGGGGGGGDDAGAGDAQPTAGGYRQSDHWRLADFDPTGPVLASVRELCLAGNAAWVDDAALARVAALCPALVALDTSGCPRVTDAGVVAVAKACGQLAELNVNGCARVTSYGIMLFCQCAGPRATRVCASGTQVSDDAVRRVLQKLPRLTVLELRGCRFDPELMRLMVERDVIYGARPTKGLPALRRLDLAFCPRLHGLAASWVAAGCSGLAAVSVRACPGLDNKGLGGLQGCRTLVELDLALNPHFTDAGVSSLRGCASAPTLRALDLSGCAGVGDAALTALAGTFPRVRSLGLAGLSRLAGPGLLQFVAAPAANPNLARGVLPDGRPAFAGESLRRLNLAGCVALRREELTHALRACERLRDVDLSGVACVDDDVLGAVGGGALRAVRRLVLRGCTRVTDFGLSLLPAATVEDLVLGGLPQLTAPAVASAVEPMLSLRRLDVRGCTGLRASRLVGALRAQGALLAASHVAEAVGGVHTTMEELRRARREFYGHHHRRPSRRRGGGGGGGGGGNGTAPGAELTYSSLAWNATPHGASGGGGGDGDDAEKAAAAAASNDDDGDDNRSDDDAEAVGQAQAGVLGLEHLNVADCCDFAFAGEREALWAALDGLVAALDHALVHRLCVVRDDPDLVGLRAADADAAALRRHE